MLRCWRLLPLAALVFLTHIQYSHSAPAFKLKHFNFYNKPNKMSSSNKLSSSANRVDRRFNGGSSPIHFINPFIQPQQTIINPFEQFFAPQLQMGAGRSPSTIYKLPLQMVANGKPHSVMRGLPKKKFMMEEYLPQVASNVIRLPLKYISNAKPIGVYFKDRSSFNYI